MDTLDTIIERLRVCKLESRLALSEIERDDLTRVIESPQTTDEGQVEALHQRRDQLRSKWCEIFAELQAVRDARS